MGRTGVEIVVPGQGGEQESKAERKTLITTEITFRGEVAEAGGGEAANFLLRAGIGYDVHIGRASLGPDVSVDILPREGLVSLVVGLAAGAGF